MRVRRRSGIFAAFAVCALATTAVAQAPFDMTPERGEAPAERQPAGPVAPAAPETERSGGGFEMPFDIERRVDDEDAAPAPAAAATPAAAETALGIDRYIVPGGAIRFDGEMGRRSWGLYLTADQAPREATLSVALNSSIFVAPEASRLRVSINDRTVLEESLAARENGAEVQTPLPPGTLRAGLNVLTFEVVQRHRTDCTVESTYSLWTEVTGAGTGITFGPGEDTGFSGLGDLAAVGFGPDGYTTLRFIVPADRMLGSADLLRLVQGVVTVGNFRQPRIEMATEPLLAVPPGTIEIAVGTVDELSGVPELPGDPVGSPTVAFGEFGGAAPMLVVSGPTAADVQSAIDYIIETTVPPDNASLALIDTTPTRIPPAPILTGERQLTFAALGLTDQEFSGRRFRSEFQVGLPGDFFAGAYGQAMIYLDAAYTDTVLPGSHIDVYVNGFIAATTPLTSEDGDIFSQLPVKVDLANFRPGLNQIALEGVLETEADAVCAPGSSASTGLRFALFESSLFVMPHFARVERWPDLAAFAGAGQPLASAGTPVPVVLGNVDREIYTAAAALAARTALASGRVVDMATVGPGSLGAGPALLVGLPEQFSPEILTELGISPSARGSWLPLPALPLTGFEPTTGQPTTNRNLIDAPPTESLYDRWETEIVSPTGFRGTIVDFERWLQESFNLSFSALSLTGPDDTLYEPPNRATLIVAQAPAASDRTWTLVAGPTAAALKDGIETYSAEPAWSELAGRVAAFDGTTGVDLTPAGREHFAFPDGELSFQNVRLAAANWLSSNILIYALVLVFLSIVLGACTSALLARLGRRS